MSVISCQAIGDPDAIKVPKIASRPSKLHSKLFPFETVTRGYSSHLPGFFFIVLSTSAFVLALALHSQRAFDSGLRVVVAAAGLMGGLMAAAQVSYRESSRVITSHHELSRVITSRSRHPCF